MSSINRLVKLAKKTNSRLIIHDPVKGNDLVILPLDDFEELVDNTSLFDDEEDFEDDFLESPVLPGETDFSFNSVESEEDLLVVPEEENIDFGNIKDEQNPVEFFENLTNENDKELKVEEELEEIIMSSREDVVDDKEKEKTAETKTNLSSWHSAGSVLKNRLQKINNEELSYESRGEASLINTEIGSEEELEGEFKINSVDPVFYEEPA